MKFIANVYDLSNRPIESRIKLLAEACNEIFAGARTGNVTCSKRLLVENLDRLVDSIRERDVITHGGRIRDDSEVFANALPLSISVPCKIVLLSLLAVRYNETSGPTKHQAGRDFFCMLDIVQKASPHRTYLHTENDHIYEAVYEGLREDAAKAKSTAASKHAPASGSSSSSSSNPSSSAVSVRVVGESMDMHGVDCVSAPAAANVGAAAATSSGRVSALLRFPAAASSSSSSSSQKHAYVTASDRDIWKRDQEIQRLRQELDAQQKAHNDELKLARQRGIRQGLRLSKPPEFKENCPITADSLTAKDAMIYPSGRPVSAAGLQVQVDFMHSKGEKTIQCSETRQWYDPAAVAVNYSLRAALTTLDQAQKQWLIEYKKVQQQIADLKAAKAAIADAAMIDEDDAPLADGAMEQDSPRYSRAARR